MLLAVLMMHGATDFLGTLERRYYDFASTSTSRQPSDRMAIIAIDDQSIANIGRLADIAAGSLSKKRGLPAHLMMSL
ncbi:MAG: hypothetical protein Q7T46_00985 [Polaromonas sp.]|nr:hypothetical protein [Polaromonas sp.]